MKNLILLLSLAISIPSFAQNSCVLIIQQKLDAANFNFNQSATNNLGNSFQLTRTQYYLSKFTLIHDGGLEINVPEDTIALVNAGNETEINLGNYTFTNLESIRFHVGVHTPVNHEDLALYSSNHPLAPQNPSMHWGWTSGYRFIAMEGNAGASNNQTLEVHALGDVNYWETTVLTSATNVNGTLIIPIKADYSEAFRGIDISQGLINHGQNGASATICTNFRDYVFSGGDPLSTAENSLSEILISPNPSNGNFNLKVSEFSDNKVVEIVDVNGQIIQTINLGGINTLMNVNLTKSGIYLLRVQGTTITKKLIVI